MRLAFYLYFERTDETVVSLECKSLTTSGSPSRVDFRVQDCHAMSPLAQLLRFEVSPFGQVAIGKPTDTVVKYTPEKAVREHCLTGSTEDGSLRAKVAYEHKGERQLNPEQYAMTVKLMSVE